MKKRLPLILLSGIALGARFLGHGLHLELPKQPWTEVSQSNYSRVISRTRRPEDIAKILGFFASHRDHWLAGTPSETPYSYISLQAPGAIANFGRIASQSNTLLSCQGMTLRLSEVENQELSNLLVDRRPKQTFADEFWHLRSPSPTYRPPPLIVEVWPDPE